MNYLADAVRDERLRREWSVRDAVAASGNLISNTWWGKFEDRKQPLTDLIRQAVRVAYDWDDDWPTTVKPPDDMADVGVQRFRFEMAQELARQGLLLDEVRAGMRVDAEALKDAVLELRRRIEALEQGGHGSV